MVDQLKEHGISVKQFRAFLVEHMHSDADYVGDYSRDDCNDLASELDMNMVAAYC